MGLVASPVAVCPVLEKYWKLAELEKPLAGVITGSRRIKLVLENSSAETQEDKTEAKIINTINALLMIFFLDRLLPVIITIDLKLKT